MRLRPHLRKRDPNRLASHAASASYLPADIQRAYGLPTAFTGKGAKVGIIELGGAFSQADFNAFRAKLGLPPKTVTCVNVSGGSQQDDPGGANVEVMLDAEIVTGLAPDADLVLYFAPNSGTGIADGINQAVVDGCDSISISWGAPEDQWAASERAATDTAIGHAVMKDINVFVAAGDSGSSDGESGNHCDYPSSSTYATGCGGTTLLNGIETVWNDNAGDATGGGFSASYPLPSYQSGIVPGSKRGVPDVAGVADPETGWLVLADGQWQTVGGTSAVAPMWAAITACLKEAAGKRVVWLNPVLYANQSFLRDVLSGNDGAYQATKGWDACTGLGSPNGVALFAYAKAGGTPPPSPPPVPVPPPPAPAPVPPPPVPVPVPVFYLAILDSTQKPVFEVPVNLEAILKALIQQRHAHLLGLPPGTLWNVFVQYGVPLLEQILAGLAQKPAGQ